VILQNPIQELGSTSVESLWKGATNHESLGTTALVQPVLCQSFLSLRLSAITVFDAR